MPTNLGPVPSKSPKPSLFHVLFPILSRLLSRPLLQMLSPQRRTKLLFLVILKHLWIQNLCAGTHCQLSVWILRHAKHISGWQLWKNEASISQPLACLFFCQKQSVGILHLLIYLFLTGEKKIPNPAQGRENIWNEFHRGFLLCPWLRPRRMLGWDNVNARFY